MSSQIKTLQGAKNVVNALRSAPTNVEAHQQVWALCNNESWPSLCEAGYPEVIEQYAQSWGDEDMGPNGLPAWHLSASESTIAFQASSTTSAWVSSSPLNIRALVRLRGVVPKIIRAMLATRNVALVDPSTSPEGEKVESCINAASGLLFAVSHSLKVQPDEAYTANLRSVGALEVAILAWYHTTHLSTRITSSITLESLLSPSGPSFSSRDSLLRLIAIIPPQSIVTKAKSALLDGLKPGNMTSGHRLVELCLIQWFVDEAAKNELGVWFVRGDTQNAVALVMRSELGHAKKRESTEADETGKRQSGPGGDMMNWELVDMAGAVLLALSNVADLPVATLIEYIERLGILEIIAQVFGDDSLVDEAPAWSNILDLLTHCTTCTASNCHYVRTDAYISALRFSLESGGGLWTNSLMRLQELAQIKGIDARKVDGRKKRLRAWYALGKQVGLTSKLPLAPPVSATPMPMNGGVQLRKQIDGCWYSQCLRHGSVDEVVERTLARCSRCKVARYDSAECQRADWHVHRGECKALKEE